MSRTSQQAYLPGCLVGIGLYAQDEWSATKNLKLTFAIRAEHNSNPVCQLNCASQFTGAFNSLSTDPTTPYNQEINANLHQIFRSTDTLNWAPRFGFAWSPGNKTTVIRGASGSSTMPSQRSSAISSWSIFRT